MKILSTASISRPNNDAMIRVLCGNLAEHARAVDLVVVADEDANRSAFLRYGIRLPPFSKAPSNSRIDHKRYRSWLVAPLHDNLRAAVLTFEPIFYETLVVAFRYLFDSFVQLVSGERLPDVKTAALPVLLAGTGGVAVGDAARPLVRGLIHWLAIGVPLERVDLVVSELVDATLVSGVLQEEMASYLESPIATRRSPRYDVFVSYSRHDSTEIEIVTGKLRELWLDVRIFRDVDSLRAGGIWQHELFLAIDASRVVLAVLSEDYLASQVCIEEYNIAMIRARQDRANVLFPVLLDDTPLPSYMQLRQFVDCRPRDRVKLQQMCATLRQILLQS